MFKACAGIGSLRACGVRCLIDDSLGEGITGLWTFWSEPHVGTSKSIGCMDVGLEGILKVGKAKRMYARKKRLIINIAESEVVTLDMAKYAENPSALCSHLLIGFVVLCLSTHCQIGCMLPSWHNAHKSDVKQTTTKRAAVKLNNSMLGTNSSTLRRVVQAELKLQSMDNKCRTPTCGGNYCKEFGGKLGQWISEETTMSLLPTKLGSGYVLTL
eukprot:1151373-Pelagomonas_calceolata.AAC.1